MRGLGGLSLRAAQVLRQARRQASHGSQNFGYGKGPYRGFVPPHTPQWQKNTAEIMGTMAWLWVFWRCKWDGYKLLVRCCPLQPGRRADLVV